jgi:hypothetical protein
VLRGFGLDQFAILTRLPKADLPADCIVNAGDLYNKRLRRSVRKGEVFHPSLFAKDEPITVPDGMDFVTLRCAVAGWDAQNVAIEKIGARNVSGTKRIDILATGLRDNEDVTFPLVENLLVVATSDGDYKPAKDTFMIWVSFVADEYQCQLLNFAKARGCRLEARGQPGPPEEEPVFVLMAKDLFEQRMKFVSELHLPIAPAPRAKPDRP